jgi:hypothetical protein
VKHFDTYSDEWLDFVVMNRNPLLPSPAHDFDIVEGPVADDKIQRTLNAYLAGRTSKEKFLKMLTHHEETHQICFCTMRSLLTLTKKDNSIFNIEDIAEQIVQQLMRNLNFDEQTASDKFFSSITFSKLADTSNRLYEKDWTEIYKLLSTELQLEITLQ